MSLLSAHFEQIAISCQGIDSLPFPPPKIFTNALLNNHDITSLIRDTEAHERALFSVPPPPPPTAQLYPDPAQQSSRRQTVFNVASGEVMHSAGNTGRGAGAPRRHTAVAAVLGGDLHDRIRRSERGTSRGEVDVELLLRGAHKLCSVYPLPGARERIPAQRARYTRNQNTIAYHEAKVAEQADALARMNKDVWTDDDDGDDEAEQESLDEILTEAALRGEEQEVRELDKRKRHLQLRLEAIEKDLDGLLHM